jgi:hypothetical protein
MKRSRKRGFPAALLSIVSFMRTIPNVFLPIISHGWRPSHWDARREMLDIGEVEIHREWRGLIGELVVSWLLKVRPQETRVKTLARSCVSEIPAAVHSI